MSTAVRVSGPIALALSLFAGAARGADAPAPPPASPAPTASKPNPITLDGRLDFGPAFRIGGSPSFETQDEVGVQLGAWGLVAPTPRFAFGVGFEHTFLGNERTGVGELGTLEVNRNLNALWGVIRMNVWSTGDVAAPTVTLFLEVGPGIVWSSERATGVSIPGFAQPPVAFACSADADASFGVRAGFGASFSLGNHLRIETGGAFEGVQLPSDPIGDCVAGPGTVGGFDLYAGFVYRFDVTRQLR